MEKREFLSANVQTPNWLSNGRALDYWILDRGLESKQPPFGTHQAPILKLFTAAIVGVL
jgi:hypothetical protein